MGIIIKLIAFHLGQTLFVFESAAKNRITQGVINGALQCIKELLDEEKQEAVQQLVSLEPMERLLAELWRRNTSSTQTVLGQEMPRKNCEP